MPESNIHKARAFTKVRHVGFSNGRHLCCHTFAAEMTSMAASSGSSSDVGTRPSNCPPTNVPTMDPAAMTRTKVRLRRRTAKLRSQTVAREPDDHRRQADREGKTAGELDIGAEQQHERRYQQFAASDAEQRRNHADQDSGGDAGNHLQRTAQQRLTSGSGIVPEDQHDGDADEKNGDHPIQRFGPEPGSPSRAEPSSEEAPDKEIENDSPMCPDRMKGTVAARNGNAVATTTRLIALLTMTASSAAKRNAPINSGRRNSAPPSPMRPPRAPTTVPVENAPTEGRAVDWGPMLTIGWFPSRSTA